MLLRSKIALITGSATGIGKGIAELFATEGSAVVLVDRDDVRNRAAAVEIEASGAPTLAISLDLRDRSAIGAAVERAKRELGPIDVLVNNAGIYPRQKFIDMTPEEWDEMQDVNLKSMFHMTQAVLPTMLARKSGKIINISSVTFHLGLANLSHYIASKGGVIGLTRALAREVGGQNVYVNCITPGAINVEAETNFVSEEDIKGFLENQSLKRRLKPLDIARVCVFLASELSDGMTGQSLNVDGGWVMR
jgi:3-oxoacyl-[acyl-carrier protein] reductase